MFGIVPRVLWERRIEPDARHRIPLAMRGLLLLGHGRVALVDCGIGDWHDPKFVDIYAIDHTGSSLHAALARHDLTTDDVTDVIVTHLHFDHAGGLVRREDDRLVPTFPNARIHVQDAHWRWARASNPKERVSFQQEMLDVVEASGSLARVDGAPDLPNLDILTVDGHTHAQQLVRLGDEGRTLLYAADLVPTAAHVATAWVMTYDVRPLTTMAEKTRILEQAASEDWSLMLEHDPVHEVVDLEQSESGFRAIAHRPLSEL